MAINATMGLKLPRSLWEQVTEHSKARVMNTSTYVNIVISELRKNKHKFLSDAILHALDQSGGRHDEPTKSTSCCIEVQALECLQEIAEKLEMSREGVLRILIRYALAHEQVIFTRT